MFSPRFSPPNQDQHHIFLGLYIFKQPIIRFYHVLSDSAIYPLLWQSLATKLAMQGSYHSMYHPNMYKYVNMYIYIYTYIIHQISLINEVKYICYIYIYSIYIYMYTVYIYIHIYINARIYAFPYQFLQQVLASKLCQDRFIIRAPMPPLMAPPKRNCPSAISASKTWVKSLFYTCKMVKELGHSQLCLWKNSEL